MKKSTLIMALALILSLALGIGGTLAYLTDTDADVNVFVMGDVQIQQNEQQRVDQSDPSKGLESFEDYKTLLPYVTIGNTTKDPVEVGDYTVEMRDESVKNYVDKIVTVSNTGNNDAFVRTIIAIPTGGVADTSAAADNWLHYNIIDDDYPEYEDEDYGWHYSKTSSNLKDLNGVDVAAWPASEADFDMVTTEINGVPYKLIIATNENILKPGETTAPSLVGIYLDSRVDKDADGYFIRIDGTKYYITVDPSEVEILVATQAVQADGFEEAGAWYALDAAFGDITATNHPWKDGMPEVDSPSDTYPDNNPPVFADVTVSNSKELTDAIADAPAGEQYVIDLKAGNYTTNVKIAGGSDIVIRGDKDTVLSGQIATTSSTAGTVTLKGVTVKVDSDIVDSTKISQTSKSAIAIWGNQTVICEDVTFEMSLKDGTAITSWWDTNEGTSIIVKNCTFNCNGQRPIRATGNVTVENCTFNDPYRYAVQLTAKADTATLLEKAIVNFNNNKIVNGPSGKAFVYGIQLEGADYGCNDCVINGSGNTIVDGGEDSAMYYCECGKVVHETIEWNVESTPVHEQ